MAFLIESAGFLLRPLRILQAYKSGYLRDDLFAGLTVAVIMLPQAVAFAFIAGLPPQMGVYSAIVASFVGGLWGSSNQLQTGPTNTHSLLVLSILLPLAELGTFEYWMLAGMLAILAGSIQILMGMLRLGLLVNFVSESVIVGFTAAAGILIFVSQLKVLFRLSIPSTPMLYDTARNLVLNMNQAHVISLWIGLGVIAFILVLRQINPKIPSALLAMVFAAVVVVALDLEEYGVVVLGNLPQGLPPLASLPLLDPGSYSKLFTGALAIAAIGLVESMSIARSISTQTGQRLDNNQEFVGQGLANFTSGLFSGYAVAGSFTRSAVNHQAGARTALSSVIAGGIVLIALVLFGSFAGNIPLAALAGVVILVAFGLIRRDEIERIWHGLAADRIIMLITFTATLTLPLEYAVLLGILLSLGYYLLRSSVPRVRVVLPDKDYKFLIPKNDNPECPQLAVIEVMGDLYFGAVNHVEDFILNHQRANPGQRYLLLRLTGVEQFDISGVHALERIVEIFRKRKGDVYISRFREPVMEIFQNSGFFQLLGDDHFLGREMDAIGKIFYTVLDPAICIYECPFRVFLECQGLPKRLDLIGDQIKFEAPPCEIKFIKPTKLWQELNGELPPMVIDVREPREFSKGHIQGAKLVSLPGILLNKDLIPKDKPVVLTCRTGRRSMHIAFELVPQGYENLRVLDGGILAWEADNLLEAIDLKGV